ncbi:MAG: chromate transporter, partial [Bacteroidia bacterium]|nr:chromate transporter [Bacteroidia bacterium]
GGGNVLYSMILTEFVEFRQKRYLTLAEFNTGLGLLQAVPGPTFSLATYANGLAMKTLGYNTFGQLIGCAVGTIAIFLPGTLMIFFVYPIWNQLKLYPIVNRSLDGIIAVAIGLVWSAACFMIMPMLTNTGPLIISNLVVMALTIGLLSFKKIPPLVIVILTILAGVII